LPEYLSILNTHQIFQPPALWIHLWT